MALRGIVKTIDMLRQPEDPSVIKADALKDAVAIKQTMIEHRNLGVFLIHNTHRRDRSSLSSPHFMRKNPDDATSNVFRGSLLRREQRRLAADRYSADEAQPCDRGEAEVADDEPSTGDLLALQGQHRVALFGRQT